MSTLCRRCRPSLFDEKMQRMQWSDLMDLKPGSRWKSAVCDTELVVVRPPKSPVTLECGGHAVVAHAGAKPDGLALATEFSNGSQAGKRFTDPETGLEILCSKSGAGSVGVDGRPIGIAETKKLPASD